MVYVPPLSVPVTYRTAVSGSKQAVKSLDDGIVIPTSKRSERTGAGGVTNGIVGCVGTRATIDQVVAAIVLDHPRAFCDVAITGLPF